MKLQQKIEDVIYSWVRENFGESEAEDPSWNIELLAGHIANEINSQLGEQLGEIQSICVGADSPDALEHGERDPIEELQCCREDISAISNITEQLQLMIGE